MINQIKYLLLFLILTSCTKEEVSIPISFEVEIDTEPVWSPDGEKILFQHNQVLDHDSLPNGIYIVDKDGNNLQLFHENGVHPTWSQDGEWIAFVFANQIVKKSVISDSLVQLTDRGRNFFPKWNPNGNLISYTQSACSDEMTCGTYTMEQDGSNKTLAVEFAIDAGWMGNEVIHYSTREIDNGNTVGTNLWSMDLVTMEKTHIVLLNSSDIRSFDYSQGNSSFVYAGSKKGNGESRIWVMDENGENKGDLISYAGYPVWSPDGTEIAFSMLEIDNTTQFGYAYLFTMNDDGSNVNQVVSY